MLIASGRAVGQAQEPAPVASSRRRPRRASRRSCSALTISAVELPTAFPYFAAIAAIVGSGLGTASQLIALALYNVAFVLPLILMIIVLGVAGDGAKTIIERARNWLQKHWPTLVAALALVAGLFVTLLGVTGLASGQHNTVGRLSRRFRRSIHH